MDIINYTTSYLADFTAKAEQTYNINPWVFGVLFFGSAIPLYYGYYRIAKSVVTIKNKKIVRKKLDKKELKIGLAISILAWILPYFYVVLFGELPLGYWIIFGVFVFVMAIFFAWTLHKKVEYEKKEAGE